MGRYVVTVILSFLGGMVTTLLLSGFYVTITDTAEASPVMVIGIWVIAGLCVAYIRHKNDE